MCHIPYASSFEAESAVDQKDLAIIHVPFSDTASVQLGDSSTVQELDELTIIGFPGNGDVSNRPTGLLTSSVNWVTVSALKTTESGASVIQVGGNVEHGDSGGPALDSKGVVVGVVSFVISDGSLGAENFLQASTSARALVQALHLDTTQGTFQQEWRQALTDYAATTPGHWHKAAQELSSMATAYPLFQAVMPYLTNAQTQASTEKIPQPPGPKPSTWIALPISAWTAGALALMLLLGFILFRYRGKRQIPALPQVHLQDHVTPEARAGTWKIDDDGTLQSLQSKMSASQMRSFFPEVTSCTYDSLTQSAKRTTATLTVTTASGQTANDPVSLLEDSCNNWKIDDIMHLPEKRLDTFCSAVQTQDYRTAYNQTSDAFQNAYPESQFAKAVSWVASCTHDIPTTTGTTVTATVTLGNSSGQTVKYKVTLIQDKNRDWKANSFQQV